MDAKEVYLRKAAEFAEKAEAAANTEVRAAYYNLADCYRRLSGMAARDLITASDAEIEALARRMVEK